MSSERWVEESLRAGRAAELVLRGGSMTPALRDGDCLTVEPLDGVPAPGEIVVASRDGRLVTHRVVWAGDGWAVTRGDACKRADPAVRLDEVVGRVVAVRAGTRRFAPPGPGRWRRLFARYMPLQAPPQVF